MTEVDVETTELEKCNKCAWWVDNEQKIKKELNELELEVDKLNGMRSQVMLKRKHLCRELQEGRELWRDTLPSRV